MKVPFRQQISGYDCVPTTLINGLSYLFSRNDIPPFIVQQVYRECLDAVACRGTSSRAVQELGFLLNNYQEKRFKKFNVTTHYLSGRQVNFMDNSKVFRCLAAKGVALLRVQSSCGDWHFILGFHTDGEWLHCYDPYTRSRRFLDHEAVRFIAPTGQQEPNLIIRLDWLDRGRKQTDDVPRKYILGDKDDRECLLMTRIRE